MRRPPPLAQLPYYPVVALFGFGAILATGAWWTGRDVSALFMTGEAFTRQPWRLVTSALLHGGMVHIAFNLYWLWNFGTILETGLGRARFFGLVLLFAAASSATEYAVGPGGVGLSGVGYGLFGVLQVLSKRSAKFAGAVDQRTVTLFAAWFVLCVVLTRMGVWHIGNVAHGSGWVMGVLVGMAMTASGARRVAWGAATALAVGACIAGGTVGKGYIDPDARSYRRAVAGWEALGRRDFAAAVPLLEGAVEGRDSDAGTWCNLGVAYEHIGRVADAERAYARALGLDPALDEAGAALERLRGGAAAGAGGATPDGESTGPASSTEPGPG